MSINLNSANLLSGNGIDVASAVNAIITGESGQITAWQTQQSTLQTQANALTGLQTDVTNLQTTINQLTDPLGALAAQTASSSNSTVLTASAQSTALSTTHQIVVSSLATNGLVYSDPTSATASILPSGQTAGDLQIQIGGAGGATKDIVITQGSNDTLNTLATYINHQNLGVTASVVTDTNGSRLAIYSQSTGSTSALSIASNNTSLTFNPPSGGTNAQFTVDGIPVNSASNTVTGAIQGVTLNLASAAPGTTVQVTVGSDTAQSKGAINDFVSAYNSLVSDINSQYTVNSATNTEGPLGSDSSLRSLQASILSDVAHSVTGNSGGLVNLASLGLNLQDDGSIKVDDAQLSSTLAANPAAVQSFFQDTVSGFATNISTDLTQLNDPTVGVINSDITGNATQQQNLTTSISNFQDKLAAQRTSLTAVYNALNASLESYPTLLLEITTELGTATTTSANSTTSTHG